MAMLKKVEAENGVELDGDYENVACKLISCHHSRAMIVFSFSIQHLARPVTCQ